MVYLNTTEPIRKHRTSLKELFQVQEASVNKNEVEHRDMVNKRDGANHEKDFQMLEVEIESFTVEMLYKFVQDKILNEEFTFKLETFDTIFEMSDKTLY